MDCGGCIAYFRTAPYRTFLYTGPYQMAVSLSALWQAVAGMTVSTVPFSPLASAATAAY